MSAKIANFSQCFMPNRDFDRHNLRKAKLSGSYFNGATFRRADLRGADLRYTKLAGCDFTGANLAGAKLEDTNLSNTKFEDANLKGTCLDPTNIFKPPSRALIEAAGLLIIGDYVHGYRTQKSILHGDAEFVVGHCYVPRYFSTSNTACHPGLYLGPKDKVQDIANMYPPFKLICVRTQRKWLLHASGKWRCKWLEVLHVV